MRDLPPLLPRNAVRFGFLGLTPLFIAGLAALSSNHDVAYLAAIAFAIYAACLLSFLGGVRCGIEIMRAPDNPDGWRLLFSALPMLGGWALSSLVVAVPGAIGASSAFAGLFAAQFIWDHRSANAGAPPWYPLLRQVLTGGVMIACLLLPLASALRRI